MNAVLSALKAMDKSVSMEIRTNNKFIADICKGDSMAKETKDLYDKYKEQEKLFDEVGGNVSFSYMSVKEKDKHLEEVRKMARNEK